MNNKNLSIKRNNAIFLATVLLAGTIALSSPSLMTNASAQSESYYGMDKITTRVNTDKTNTKPKIMLLSRKSIVTMST